MEAEQVTPDMALRELARRELARRQSAQQPEAQQNMGSILPIASTPGGGWEWNSDAGIVGMVKHALKLPGDVYSGDVQMVDPETGHTSQETIERSIGAAAVLSPMNPMVRSGGGLLGSGMAPRIKSTNVAPPTAEALRAASKEGYDSARDMGVQYNSSAVRDMASSARAELEQEGILAELAPKSFKILRKLQSPPEGSVAELAGIDAARKAFKNARLDFANPTERLAADRIVQRLDEFLEASDPGSVVAGPAAAASAKIREARGNYAAAKRSEKLYTLERNADLDAGTVGSGQNLDNAIRQNAKRILKNPKQSAGFSKGELKLIENVARGNVGRNTLRYVGNLLGGGGGLGAVVSGGVSGAMATAAGGPAAGALIGIGTPLTGMASKRAANYMTGKALSKADRAVRMRSPLYEKMLREAGSKRMSPAKRAALMRLLLIEQTAGD